MRKKTHAPYVMIIVNFSSPIYSIQWGYHSVGNVGIKSAILGVCYRRVCVCPAEYKTRHNYCNRNPDSIL